MECLHHVLTVPAKVSKGPDNLKAKRGTTVVLKAEISGEPPPDVAWLKDGDDIEEDDRWNAVLFHSSKKNILQQIVLMEVLQMSFRVFFDIGDANTILTIKNAKLSDAGKYEVFVENNLGTDQSFARVDIL